SGVGWSATGASARMEGAFETLAFLPVPRERTKSASVRTGSRAYSERSMTALLQKRWPREVPGDVSPVAILIGGRPRQAQCDCINVDFHEHRVILGFGRRSGRAPGDYDSTDGGRPCRTAISSSECWRPRRASRLRPRC